MSPGHSGDLCVDEPVCSLFFICLVVLPPFVGMDSQLNHELQDVQTHLLLIRLLLATDRASLLIHTHLHSSPLIH